MYVQLLLHGDSAIFEKSYSSQICSTQQSSPFLDFCHIYLQVPKSQGRGELLVSLCYQPAANRLTVVVLKAKNLPKMDVTGLSGELNFSRPKLCPNFRQEVKT